MLTFEKNFFEDRYEGDFFVPGMVRRSWAAQLEVYEIIKKICEKYSITYYADWGTMLGTVRHKGFIPWDDDLDICMKREDLLKFLAVAPSEVPTGFKVLNSLIEPKHHNIISRVVNSEGINISKDFLDRFHGCPYVVGVDIFAIDTVVRDEKLLNVQVTILTEIRRLADLYIRKVVKNEELEDAISAISEAYLIKLPQNIESIDKLYMLWQLILGMYKESDGNFYTSMHHYAAGRHFLYEKSWLQKGIVMPFENTVMIMPEGYDDILKQKYGPNYLTPVKRGGSHGYPFYKEQEDILMKSELWEQFINR